MLSLSKPPFKPPQKELRFIWHHMILPLAQQAQEHHFAHQQLYLYNLITIPQKMDLNISEGEVDVMAIVMLRWSLDEMESRHHEVTQVFSN